MTVRPAPSISATARKATEAVRPVAAVVRMNIGAAIRTRRRGYAGWTGAINTDYDPQDPATAAEPFDAYRALHRGGRVRYNPRRATFIVSRLDDVRANPDLIPLAVEEQLRITTPIQNLYRYTRADYRIGDVIIPTGSRVLLSFGAANRDPLAFDDPDDYHADRDPRKHVAFGYGPHMCLGAPLARMEAQAVLRQLVTRAEQIIPEGPTRWSSHPSADPAHSCLRR